MAISVLNTDSDLTGKTLLTAENAYTVSGLHTFSRNPGAPYAVSAGSAYVPNLGCDAAKIGNPPIAIATGGTGNTGALTNGQLWIGNTGSPPSIAALTAGAGISITNAAGSITIADTAFQLLHQGSGTDTTATPTNVDSFTVTGLTVKDLLVFYFQIESITAATTNPVLQQTTDNVIFVSLTNSNPLAAGNTQIGHGQFGPRQGSTVNLQAISESIRSDATRVDAWNNPSTTALWTGTWALSLRHNGVVATGTFKYVWAVYKLAGQ